METAARKWQLRLSAVCGMLLGLFLTAIAVYLLNQVLEASGLADQQVVTDMQVAALPPPPPSVKKVPPRPKVRPRVEPSSAPLPQIDSPAAALDLAAEEFGWLDNETLSTRVLGEVKELAMTADTVDKPPIPIKQGGLPYPPYARQRGIEGHVVMNLLISKAGLVEKSQILESVPSGVFEQVALQAVQQWRFEPAQYAGKTVQVWSKRTIRFSLN
jgi:protein TonB